MFRSKASLSRPDRPLLRVVRGTGTIGSPLDFDTVFRRYSVYVASVGLKLLGRDDNELDDLVQDVFLEAHRGLAGVRESGAVKGWLVRICVRRCVRRLRRRKLYAFLHIGMLERDQDVACKGASPEESAQVSAIYRRLERLHVDQRVAWVLRHVEGESLDEIASLCGCSKSTVQRRLRAAEQEIERGLFA